MKRQRQEWQKPIEHARRRSTFKIRLSRGETIDIKSKKKVCTMYNKGKCTKIRAERPLIHNPTCQWHQAGRCRDGGNCLFPHRETGGVLVVKQQPSKKLEKDDEQKAKAAAAKVQANAKPKAKAKAKADVR